MPYAISFPDTLVSRTSSKKLPILRENRSKWRKQDRPRSRQDEQIPAIQNDALHKDIQYDKTDGTEKTRAYLQMSAQDIQNIDLRTWKESRQMDILYEDSDEDNGKERKNHESV